jgi:hypothetical protein
MYGSHQWVMMFPCIDKSKVYTEVKGQVYVILQ